MSTNDNFHDNSDNHDFNDDYYDTPNDDDDDDDDFAAYDDDDDDDFARYGDDDDDSPRTQPTFSPPCPPPASSSPTSICQASRKTMLQTTFRVILQT